MAVHRVALTPDEVERDFRQVYSLVHHDRDDGFLRWEQSPDPLMLLWAPRLFEFLQVMEGTISFLPARGMCREVGYRSGHQGAIRSLSALMIEAGGPLEALLAMPRVLAGAGWGTSELAYNDGTGTIEWTFPKGTAIAVSARAAGPRTNPACAFFEGFGAGWVRGSVGADVEFVETACFGRGDPQCRLASRPLG